ncbi:hypothetical protein [Streptomyces sp. bgisy060]|uniref:hypothetical protein n=1 Tax=Streptomyces sp. bgisy060 TaxID=3413775 RepID=UPI003EB8F014
MSTMGPSGPSAVPIPLHIDGEPPAPPAPYVIGMSAGPGRRPAPVARSEALDWAALGGEITRTTFARAAVKRWLTAQGHVVDESETLPEW